MICNTFTVIASFLSPRDLCRCARVCRTLHRWVFNNCRERWKQFKEIFPALGMRVLPTRKSYKGKNLHILEALIRLHFQNSVLVMDISKNRSHPFHMQIIQSVDGQLTWDWERPIWIYLMNYGLRFRARWGEFHFASWPGPKWKRLFTPYLWFLKHGKRPPRELSIFYGWKFNVRE